MSPGLVFIPLFAALLFGAFVQGCGKPEGDLPYVDLRKTASSITPKGPGRSEALKIAGAPMISPLEGYEYYRQMLKYISARLERPVSLVQRKTYHEINELLRSGGVDAAFVCSGAYVKDAEESGIEILVVPHANGEPYYRSYLITGINAPYRSLEDLRGTRFAFTDPLSFSGKFYPLSRLKLNGETAEGFFSRVVYSGSHDNSVRAVARGEVDGASVDSLIYDYMRSHGSPESGKTKILETSEPFGIPPFVVSRHVANETRQALKVILLGMADNTEGKRILGHLGLDGFYPPPPGLYASIRKILAALEER